MAVQFTASLSRGGRGIEAATARMARRVRVAAARSANVVGERGRKRAERALGKLLDVPPDIIQSQRRLATLANPVYLAVFPRRGYPVADTRRHRFRPYPRQRRTGGGAQVGSLTIRSYGRRITLEGVLRTRGPRDSYSLPETSTRQSRPVYGPILTRGYRQVNAIKATLRREFVREFRRQLRKA